MKITKEYLSAITHRPEAVFSADFVSAIENVCHRYEINTPLRVAHFLAQICYESGGFRWPEEIWGPTPHQEGYEGRADLGNTEPGDGHRFRGRGFIQLTGRSNYKEYSDAAGYDFISDPDELSELPWSLNVCGWFWKKRGINTWADADDVHGVTRRVNGGTNGLAERKRILLITKALFVQGQISLHDPASLPTKTGANTPPPRTSPIPERVVFEEKPWWASKRIWGWAITVAGVFGSNTEVLSAILGNYDAIITVVGLLINLYGSIVAKQKVTLWKQKK